MSPPTYPQGLHGRSFFISKSKPASAPGADKSRSAKSSPNVTWSFGRIHVRLGPYERQVAYP